jgi:Cu(I)/Ag(I) efflux system membrane fusion protein
MNKQGFKVGLAVILMLAVAAGVVFYDRYHLSGSNSAQGQKDLYYCPMHPSFTADKPRDCAICGMSLVKRQTSEKKSEVSQASGSESTVVYINPAKQQLIGVKKEKIAKRNLQGQIQTVGIVAYDPDLYVTQQEYLQSLKSSRALKEQLDPTIMPTKRKLMLLGMSEEEIAELEKTGQPQQFLYLPQGGKIWVYITVYEYEMEFVKKGLAVKIESLAYPGQVFAGTVVNVAPILDKMTRTLKVRALVDDPENKLKPEMYVNAKISYELGEKLAVPQEAVMRAGMGNYVFVVDANDHFYSRAVVLGNKVQNFYEIREGLSEGQIVVTSGNFLIDSESKLNAVLDQAAEPNK